MLKNPHKNLPLQNVSFNDGFWNKYLHLVDSQLLAYQWELINDRVEDATESFSIRNFRIAAGEIEGEHLGEVYRDTDIAKWLEAVGFSLGNTPNPALEKLADETIELIAKAQCEDGYINTYYTLREGEERWSNLFEGHELYTAGHFIEAAVAYYRGTGKRRFLDVMARCADNICDTFGTGEGQIPGYPGHQEIELALIKLYEVTGTKRYLETAYYFITQRGIAPQYFYGEECFKTGNYLFPEFKDFDLDYCQAHLPVNEQETADGHAVRAVYMYSAMADLAHIYNDEKLLASCRRLFDNIVEKRMYITGSIGSAAYGERFTTDYDLPNDSNYSETCASIGLAMFAHRMFKITGESYYMDTAERALYNTLLSGIALDGEHFYYVNPLEVVPEVAENNPTYRHVKTERQRWFGCACCPTNIARTLASLSDYAFSAGENTLFTHLYISGTAKTADGSLALRTQTQYPYDGKVEMTVEAAPGSEYTVALRIPGFAPGTRVAVNGEAQTGGVEKGYMYLKRQWAVGDTITLDIGVEPKLVYCNPRVRENLGKTALVKGPLVYCLEEQDNTAYLASVEVDPSTPITAKERPDLLGGTLTLHLKGKMPDYSEVGAATPLYDVKLPGEKPLELTAIPYCLWNNRGKGEMLVWMRYGK